MWSYLLYGASMTVVHVSLCVCQAQRQCLLSWSNICAKFGVDSSTHCPFRARTDRHTDKSQTKLISVGNQNKYKKLSNRKETVRLLHNIEIGVLRYTMLN